MIIANRESDDVICRLLVVGSSRVRLNKIFSSLTLPRENKDIYDARYRVDNLQIEYLPCIAKFASYVDGSKTNVRYLESVEHYPHDSTGTLASVSSSLLEYFDQDKVKYDNTGSWFPPIAGVAIGSGIEGPDDSALISGWIRTMLSGNNDPIHPKIKTIEPNANYQNMSDELVAYKHLSPVDKDAANRHQTMGPEKMVKFVIDFTVEIIQEAYKQMQPSADVLDPKRVEPIPEVPHIVDSSKNQYFCRICRTALFGENDLQDPPHEVSQHNFSRRKMHHGGSTITDSISVRCQSYFLQQNLQWMDDDIQNGVSEGKFHCPNCSVKLGTWIWSGTQCSCGTWVVPAIQVPISKVDVVKPSSSNLHLSTSDMIQETDII